ncbi:MvdC/MvdD family ATP grasp protein [Chryseobacterium sp. JUb7]|uniref:MvdC/MvdD family ATP grasp protein n=1 Tax=Chryseobacterium sp. JUb7 TaxID=2940599 RepID=UPI002169A3A1|nr:hypothetical protein [Chryseobacterium sp. JUb7]MCS3531245.1 glutathione synthase/RimK-type ligase-like ATP-grasp enzyme [Chryseobacterium sp. JUb7]
MMIRVLLITNKADITTDFVVKKLKEKKIEFYRLNTEELGDNVEVNLDFHKDNFKISDRTTGNQIDLLDIRSVYFRRPELPNDNSELSRAENQFIRNEISYTLEGIYKILNSAYWLNNVKNIRNAENKIFQLRLAKKIGFTIAHSLITTNAGSAMNFYGMNEEDCIIKPIRTGLISDDGNEEAIIFTNKIYLDKNNAQRVEGCPTFFQKHIKKRGDIRVTVVGEKVFAAFIHSQDSDDSKVDWRVSQDGLKHSIYMLPEDISANCINLLRELDLNFGAIDLILNENGEYVFLEINPNGQWAWLEKLLGLDISGAIVNLLKDKIDERETT